jgi:hypothetical protein
MSAYPIPEVKHVTELLGMLFDGMTVKPGAKLDLSANSGGFAGVYVTDEGQPVALCACDLAFAANSGAALSMLPPNMAKESIKSKELSETMTANLREVMNICTRLVLREGTPHLRLSQVYDLKSLPAPATAIISGAGKRIDFTIGLGKYGNGILAVLVL